RGAQRVLGHRLGEGRAPFIRIGLGVRGAGDEDYRFALGVGLAELLRQIAQRSAEAALELLGQLQRHDAAALGAEDFGHRAQAFGQPPRRLVEHQRLGARREVAQRLLAPLGFGRQEAEKAKGIGRQAGHGQRTQQRRGARRREHRQAALASGAHQRKARIAEERRAGVGDQRHAAAAPQILEDGADQRALIVLVQRLARRADAEMLAEPGAGPRVLAVDHVGRGQGLEPTQRHVAQIADRRRHDMKARRQLRRLKFSAGDEIAARVHQTSSVCLGSISVFKQAPGLCIERAGWEAAGIRVTNGFAEITRRRALLGGLSLFTLSGCSAGDLNFSNMLSPITGPQAPAAPQGQSFGTGPVQVAMLLPLSGDPSLIAIGSSMANGAQLAMEFIGSSPSMKDNITLTIKDTGTTAQGAAQAASQAVSEGASLILGPLLSDQVGAVAGVTRSAGINVIAFSNNPGAAQPGVYLLNVLPGSETHRSLGYARAQGRKAFAGL